MNTDTQALIQYLATLLEAAESRGVEAGSFRAEAINEIMEEARDPDYRGDLRPTGKCMVVMAWRWADETRPTFNVNDEGQTVTTLEGHYGG